MQWHCLCSCGKYTTKKSNFLRNGKSTSCGCRTKIKRKKSMKQYNTYDLSNDFGIGYTKQNEIFYFDLEDYDKIKDYCWHYDKDGYILSSVYNETSIKMHNLLMNATDGTVVDHKNGNRNDNRKENLRIATFSQNGYNSNKPSNNTSGYKGVHWNKSMNAWQARIQVDGKRYNLGYFNDKIDAAKAYNEAAIIYHGEFAKLNNIDG